jgi:hypothetical protein
VCVCVWVAVRYSESMGVFTRDQVISNKTFNTLKTFLVKKGGRRRDSPYDAPDEGIVSEVAKVRPCRWHGSCCY